LRKPAAIAAAVLVPAALAAPALAVTKTVKVGDNWFVRSGTPTTVTVKKGTTVTWKWVGDNPHNVTVVKGPVKFKSSTKSSGTFSKRMRRKGTYRLICTVHGSGQRMTLKVN
jgi:plastocyanin